MCHGRMVNPVLEAAKRLSAQGVSVGVLKVNRIRPLAAEPILTALRKTGKLLTVEDACRTGNVGGMVLIEVAKSNTPLRAVRQLDLGSGVVTHGAPEELYHSLGLDAEGIYRAAMEMANEEIKA